MDLSKDIAVQSAVANTLVYSLVRVAVDAIAATRNVNPTTKHNLIVDSINRNLSTSK